MPNRTKERQPKYYLDAQGGFVIQNYNFAKPFADFFPGIAGKYGIPIWVFYVNRGQAISSFGTRDKDHAILEFFPANRSWQLTSLQGFRSFIKLKAAKKNIFYEPFANGSANSGFELSNHMRITSYDLKLEEINKTLGLKTRVEYFTIPNDNYGALARIVTLENTGRSLKRIEFIDGLPQVIPFKTSNFFLKKLSRTIEAWMNVENMDKGVPFYKLAVEPADRPEVVHIKGGNFYLSFHYEKEKLKVIRPIIDPQYVFGPVVDFSCPYNFIHADKFRPPQKNTIQSKTPAGLAFSSVRLGPSEQKTFYTLAGYMLSRQILNSALGRITRYGYLDEKRRENQDTIEELQQDIDTASSSREFDLYARQTYLDNIMRGGYPVVFKSADNHNVFYLYSRKHGDLERDYNKFQIQPNYFSQGNGNYRDVNQNRRCAVWFNPQVEDENIITFFNLIQADGFNPLVLKPASFILENPDRLKDKLKSLFKDDGGRDTLLEFLCRHQDAGFSPGEAILYLEEHKAKLKVSRDEFVNALIECSRSCPEAEHGEGFWTDHWVYNLDLLEAYLGVYPDKLKEIVFRKRAFTFYDNAETVRPRNEKYLLYSGLPRQLHAVSIDNAKRELIRKRKSQSHLARAQFGQGEVYKTTLLNKLLCLLANKFASLDPFGRGIEMEANKPNWFDALNGLPALFGSSLNETFGLKRLIIWLKKSLAASAKEKVYVTEEIYALLKGLDALTGEYFSRSNNGRDYQYWDKAHSAKEAYWQKVRFGFSGRETEVAPSELSGFLDNALRKTEEAIAGARLASGAYNGYFINEVVKYEPLKEPHIRPLKFVQKPLPLFLEPQVHALRAIQDVSAARKIYKAVRASGLYDKKLKMYKVTASLSKMPQEIGRCRVFAPGWLENESIWLHMEYKYLLETLRSGLYEEFYADFKNVLIPFQQPGRYGRSILENSSFLVGSAFADPSLHGNGFIARLSGSTAEFLQIWLVMNVGPAPFVEDAVGRLNLKFSPVLAGWLFSNKDKAYSFNFLGKVKVTYHNPGRKNTFGQGAAKINSIVFTDKDGLPVKIPSSTIPSPYAAQIRALQVKQIDIFLG